MATKKKKIVLADNIVASFQRRITERDQTIEEAQAAYKLAEEKKEKANKIMQKIGGFFEGICEQSNLDPLEYEYVPSTVEGDEEEGGYLQRLSDDVIQRLRQAEEEETQQEEVPAQEEEA